MESLISVPQMAKRLGVSVPMGYKLIALGRLPHISVEGAIRIDPEDLEEYKKGRRTVGTPPERRNPKKGRRVKREGE